MSTRRKRPPAPAAAPTTTPPKRHWTANLSRVAALLDASMAAGEIPRRPFAPPQLPPGVVPERARNPLAMDNAGSNYAFLNSQAGFCGMGFPGYTYLSELSQRSEYRAPTETIATEMTREWVKIVGASEQQQKDLEKAFIDFNLQACFRTIGLYDGFFGRGQLYVRIKGQDSDQRRKLPLLVDDTGATVTKGSLLGFKPIEPIWTTPYSYNSIDPTLPDFYKPDWWYVLGKQTHSSRLLTFVSRPLPDILKPSYNFGGMSLSQLIEPYVVRWLKTVDSVNRLISNFSITALATNMQATLEGAENGDGLFKRAALFNQLRDNRALMLLDMDSEDLLQKNVPLSGLSELQAQAQEHMAAPTHIPLVKLTGITPSGLNASSDGEIKVFYDFIAAEQENQFNAHLHTCVKLIQLHLWGKVDPNIKVEWIPLDSPTDAELAKMRVDDGKRDTDYVGTGILSPEEVRERLRTDPNSGYTGISKDAPPPPLEQEAALGEEKADADHARGEEAAAAAHERAKDLEKTKARAKPKPKGAQDVWNESAHNRDEIGRFATTGALAGVELTSSQQFRDDNIVSEKRKARDFKVQVSPEFEIDGRRLRAVLDGHHSLSAAIEEGVFPEFTEQGVAENDAIALLRKGDVQGFLEAVHLGDDYHNPVTKESTW